MTHIPMGTLVVFEAGELGQPRRRRTAAHLAACPRCRERLAWVREVRGAARTAATVPAPAGAWDVIRERFEKGDVVLLPPLEEAPPRAARRRAAWAAALVLLAAGGAAAAVPASPVRDWLVRAWSALHAPAPEAPPAEGTAVAAPAVPDAVLLVAPERGGVAIAVERPGADVRIRVREWDGADVEVRATGAAAGAGFRSAPGRLAIVEPQAGEIRLALPASLERATLEVDGVAVLVKSGGALRVLSPAASSADAEIVLPVRRRDR